jgi:hypothetical protein
VARVTLLDNQVLNEMVRDDGATRDQDPSPTNDVIEVPLVNAINVCAWMTVKTVRMSRAIQNVNLLLQGPMLVSRKFPDFCSKVHRQGKCILNGKAGRVNFILEKPFLLM